MSSMEARELRLGNKVLCKWTEEEYSDDIGNYIAIDKERTGTVVQLDGLSVNDYPIMVESNGNIEYYDEIAGVPLTEDWLLRLGFELGSDICGECYFKEKPEPEFAIRLYDGLFVWLTTDKQINYVHELQNLFYVITGQELTLKQE